MPKKFTSRGAPSTAAAPKVEFLMVAEDPQRQKEHVAQEKLFPTNADTVQFHITHPSPDRPQGLSVPLL